MIRHFHDDSFTRNVLLALRRSPHYTREDVRLQGFTSLRAMHGEDYVLEVLDRACRTEEEVEARWQYEVAHAERFGFDFGAGPGSNL